jgi:hypothetical protein
MLEMNDPGPVALEVSLGEDDTFGRLHVELAAYCDFDAWMDVQVESLISLWAHLAAPASARCRRSSVTGA